MKSKLAEEVQEHSPGESEFLRPDQYEKLRIADDIRREQLDRWIAYEDASKSKRTFICVDCGESMTISAKSRRIRCGQCERNEGKRLLRVLQESRRAATAANRAMAGVCEIISEANRPCERIVVCMGKHNTSTTPIAMCTFHKKQSIRKFGESAVTPLETK